MAAHDPYLMEAASCESQAAQAKQQVTLVAALGLVPYKDGAKWCVLWGENIQNGICGFGDTPSEAIHSFNNEYYGIKQ